MKPERGAKPVALSAASANTGPVDDVAGIKSKGETGPIVLYAHNLRLRQGPSFRVYTSVGSGGR